jgi:hypothetical protein
VAVTDHIYGEGSYVECDRYHVVTVITYEEKYANLAPELHTKQDCYCGNQATEVARVAFYTVVEEREDWWDREISRIFKAHRCDEHSFREE